MHILAADWSLFPSHFYLLIYLFKTAQFILSRYVGVLVWFCGLSRIIFLFPFVVMVSSLC